MGSVIASYVFYVFCIHPAIFKERRVSAIFLNFILKRMVKLFEVNIKGVSDSLNLNSTCEDVKVAFLKLAPYKQNAPLIIKVSPQVIYSDWFSYFNDCNESIKENLVKLMDSKLIIDIEVIYLLNKINDCGWFMIVNQLCVGKSQLAGKFANPFINSMGSDKSLFLEYVKLKYLILSLKDAIKETERFIYTNRE